MKEIILFFVLIVSFSSFVFCAESEVQQIYVPNTSCNTNNLTSQQLFYNNQWVCGREQWLSEVWALGSAPYFLNVSDFWASATCPNCIGNYGTFVSLLSGINQTVASVFERTMQTMYAIAPMWCQHGDQFCENITTVTNAKILANITSYPVCTRIWCYYNPGTNCRPVDNNRNPLPNTLASCLTAGEFVQTHQGGCPIWNCVNSSKKKRSLINRSVSKKKKGARKWLKKRELSETEGACSSLYCGSCTTSSAKIQCWDQDYTNTKLCCNCLSFASESNWV